MTRLSSITRALFSMALAGALASCSTHPTADLSMQAAKYLNPDMNGQPSPVMVNVYELKSSASQIPAGHCIG